MDVGDPVALACEPKWTGRIERVKRGGRYDVALDAGGKAMGMTEDDLVREEPKDKPTGDEDRERERASGDKSWPPKGLETKVPKANGAK